MEFSARFRLRTRRTYVRPPDEITSGEASFLRRVSRREREKFVSFDLSISRGSFISHQLKLAIVKSSLDEVEREGISIVVRLSVVRDPTRTGLSRRPRADREREIRANLERIDVFFDPIVAEATR